MKDTLTSHNHQDFRARYGGTYGWLVDGDKRKFVYVDSSNAFRVYFTEGGETVFHANADAGVEFEFIPVNRGWFNAKDKQVWYLERVPARQWRRGICDSNTSIYNINKIDWQERLTYQRLASIFSPGFDNWKVENYNKGPYALSRNFAVDASGNIYFYNTVVGIATGGEYKITNKIIYQEMVDLVRRKNIGFKVVMDD